jgi:hypothetical protein
LRMTTQSRAMLTSVAILVAMALAGPVLRLVIDSDRHYADFWPGSIYSPAAVIGELLWTNIETGDVVYLLIANTFIYGGLALGFRIACSLQAARLLGRAENEPVNLLGERPVEPISRLEPQPAEAGEMV